MTTACYSVQGFDVNKIKVISKVTTHNVIQVIKAFKTAVKRYPMMPIMLSDWLSPELQAVLASQAAGFDNIPRATNAAGQATSTVALEELSNEDILAILHMAVLPSTSRGVVEYIKEHIGEFKWSHTDVPQHLYQEWSSELIRLLHDTQEVYDLMTCAVSLQRRARREVPIVMPPLTNASTGLLREVIKTIIPETARNNLLAEVPMARTYTQPLEYFNLVRSHVDQTARYFQVSLEASQGLNGKHCTALATTPAVPSTAITPAALPPLQILAPISTNVDYNIDDASVQVALFQDPTAPNLVMALQCFDQLCVLEHHTGLAKNILETQTPKKGCFSALMNPQGQCQRGDKCRYNHDPQVLKDTAHDIQARLNDSPYNEFSRIPTRSAVAKPEVSYTNVNALLILLDLNALLSRLDHCMLCKTLRILRQLL